MILAITDSGDVHADLVLSVLRERNIPSARLNYDWYPKYTKVSLWQNQSNQSTSLTIRRRRIDLSSVRVVWYRGPQRLGLPSHIARKYQALVRNESREALQGIYHLLDSHWVNGLGETEAAHNKINQMKVARQCGFNVPKTLVTTSLDEVRDFQSTAENGIVIKQMTKNLIRIRGKEYWMYTNLVKDEDLRDKQNAVVMPSLFQEYIQKKFEIRATIVGTQVFAAVIHSQRNPRTMIDWRRFDKNMKYTTGLLPADIEKRCLSLMRKFRLLFAAVDLVVTPSGDYYFLDVNPTGQWLWIEDSTGLGITNELVSLLANLNNT